MAIERYMLATTNDLKDLIEGLGWFDNVTVGYDIFDGVLVCTLGNVVPFQALNVAGPTGDVSYTYANQFNTGTRTFYMGGAAQNKRIKYAFKTKNGLLLTNNETECRSQVLIGKTDAGSIACCMSCSTDTMYKFYTAAVGEIDEYIGTDNRTLGIGIGGGSSRYRWTGSPQITACQIPTCPSSGASYIKGALLLVTTNMDSLGIIEINGIQYVTTGDICLNDED